MRSIRWLHISDFHLRESTAWSQDTVLTALCESIEKHCRTSSGIDFVLATGDFAFSGKEAEYELVTDFLSRVAQVTELPLDRIYCVPGNHDVDRDRQTTCFAGARHILDSENKVDEFLGSPEEAGTLLERQSAYIRAQNALFAGQKRFDVCGGLAFVVPLTIEQLNIAIIGLNTAWLAEGGRSDHGNLLVGDRQMIDATKLAQDLNPHLTIAIGHHPFHLLREFDRACVQKRVEDSCDFYHCGHLHEPESREVANKERGCLTVAAGSSFETRTSKNSYAIVTLDVLAGERTVTTVHFDSITGTFSSESTDSWPLTIQAPVKFDAGALGSAIKKINPENKCAYHMAALLTGAQEEVAVLSGNRTFFASRNIAEEQPEGELKIATLDFLALRNALNLFSEEINSTDFVDRYRDTILEFVSAIASRAQQDSSFASDLEARESSARAMVANDDAGPFANTRSLLKELAHEQQWTQLAKSARRALAAERPEIAVLAQRYLAQALAQSEQSEDRSEAKEIINQLLSENVATADDVATYAALSIGDRSYDVGKETIRKGLTLFPKSAQTFIDLGQRIVAETGDHQFRDELNQWDKKDGQAS